MHFVVMLNVFYRSEQIHERCVPILSHPKCHSPPATPRCRLACAVRMCPPATAALRRSYGASACFSQRGISVGMSRVRRVQIRPEGVMGGAEHATARQGARGDVPALQSGVHRRPEGAMPVRRRRPRPPPRSDDLCAIDGCVGCGQRGGRKVGAGEGCAAVMRTEGGMQLPTPWHACGE
jgi:hypothetical protein